MPNDTNDGSATGIDRGTLTSVLSLRERKGTGSSPQHRRLNGARGIGGPPMI